MAVLALMPLVSPASRGGRACDQCEAVATQIGLVLGRQRRPQRLGGGLRQGLRESELEELFAEQICLVQQYQGYAVAHDASGRQRLAGEGITPLKQVGDPDTTLRTMMAAMTQNVGKRLARRCETVADTGQPLLRIACNSRHSLHWRALPFSTLFSTPGANLSRRCNGPILTSAPMLTA
jgi:hypothetical protein